MIDDGEPCNVETHHKGPLDGGGIYRAALTAPKPRRANPEVTHAVAKYFQVCNGRNTWLEGSTGVEDTRILMDTRSLRDLTMWHETGPTQGTTVVSI